MEDIIGGAIAAAFMVTVWLLGVCTLLYSAIEEASNHNPHDGPFPWQRCYWLCVLLSLPVVLPMSLVFPILLVPIATMLVLGYYQSTKEDRERVLESKVVTEQLFKKYPVLNEVPPCDPLSSRNDQFRIFDTSWPAPAYLGLASRNDISYLVDLFGKTETYFGARSNNFMLFLGSLEDDTEPKFFELLGSCFHDEFHLSPQIQKSKLSCDLYGVISARLIRHGSMCLRWTE